MGNFNVDAQSNPSLTTSKTVDLNFATVGDILNYTVVIKNNGDTSANSLIVTDLIPQGANFVNDSVKINGVAQLGVNPALGVNVFTVPIGAIVTITMQALVVTLPWTTNLINYAQTDYQYIDITTTPSTITASIDSNNVVTTINTPIMDLVKSSTPSIITGNGQTITYVLTLNNYGNATANNVTFLDTMPNGTSFVPNSVQILGNPVSGTVLPPTGLNIGALPNGFFTTLSFKVTVTSVPSNNSISNFCDVAFDYLVNPTTARNVTSRSTSNTLSLFTSNLRVDLSGIRKWVDKKFATTNDILTYVVTIPNSGNTTALNVVVVDTIPSGTSYVANSLLVNGLPSSNLPISINVGTIAAGTLATLQFKLKVN